MIAFTQLVRPHARRVVTPAPLCIASLLALLLVIAPRHPQQALAASAARAPIHSVAHRAAYSGAVSHQVNIPLGIRASVALFTQAQAGSEYWLHRAPAPKSAVRYTVQSPQQHLSARFAGSGIVTIQAAGGARVRMQLAALNGQIVPTRIGAGFHALLTYRHGALTEWWRSGPLGIEQGFTIPSAALTQHGRVAVRVAIAASAPIGQAGADLRFGGLQLGNVIAWDARGRLLPIHTTWQPAPRGRGGDYTLAVATHGARFPVTIDPTLALAMSTAQGDAYTTAQSVAMSTDGGYLAVGTNDIYNVSDSVIMLFKHPAAGWASLTSTGYSALVAPVAIIEAANATDRFGSAIALNRDGSVVLAGAPGAGNNSGLAYVFVEPAAGWGVCDDPAITPFDVPNVTKPFNVCLITDATTLLQDPRALNLSTNQLAADHEFGSAVALDASGSVAAVGAYGSNLYTGFVYVYQPAGGVATRASWTDNAPSPVTFPDPCTTGRCGTSVQGLAYGISLALSADGNALLVGTPDVYGNNGQAHLYLRSQQAWNNYMTVSSPTVTFLDPDTAAYTNGNYFAQAVALSGDASTVLIGAYNLPELYGSSVTSYPSLGGMAYLFAQPTSGWVSGSTVTAATTTFTDPHNTAGDEFGGAVALNGSGTAAVIGALGDTGGEGTLYVYAEPLGGWPSGSGIAPTLTYADPYPSAPLDPPAPPVDAFGLSLALAGDVGLGGAMNQLTNTDGNARTYLTGDTYAISVQTGWTLISSPLLALDPGFTLRATEVIRQIYAQIASTSSPFVALYQLVNGSWSAPIMDQSGALSMNNTADYFLQPGARYLVYAPLPGHSYPAPSMPVAP